MRMPNCPCWKWLRLKERVSWTWDWAREASFKSKNMMLKNSGKVETRLHSSHQSAPPWAGSARRSRATNVSLQIGQISKLSMPILSIWARRDEQMDLSITLTLQGGGGGGGGGQGGDHQHQHGFSSLQRERGRERGGEQRRGGGERGEVARRRGEGEEKWWGEGETVWRQVEVFARGHRPQQSDHCIINHTEGLHINYRSFCAVIWKCRKYEKFRVILYKSIMFNVTADRRRNQLILQNMKTQKCINSSHFWQSGRFILSS